MDNILKVFLMIGAFLCTVIISFLIGLNRGTESFKALHSHTSNEVHDELMRQISVSDSLLCELHSFKMNYPELWDSFERTYEFRELTNLSTGW